MPNYITCYDLTVAKETKEKLIGEGHPNAWIETIIRGKEFRVHSGEDSENGKFVPNGKLSEEVNKD